MRELESCDFCAERADGVYEVLPPEVAADERRLVLCADCRDTLAGVVEPLLDAVEAAREAGPATDASADRGVTLQPSADETPETPDDADATTAADTDAGETAAASSGDASEVSETAAEGTRGADVDADAEDATAGDTDSEDATAGAVDVDDATAGDTDASDGASDADASAATGARPEGYRRVVRLLRNRPEAMTRTDLAELAAGAYDLDASDVEAVVDAAVENGHLEETPEGLRAA